MNRQSEVIVVGAGPVGSVVALGLARAGIGVTVIESEAAVNSDPRAAVYLPVSLELLDRIGVIDDAAEAGVHNDLLQINYRDLGESVQLSPSVISDCTRFPYQLHFGQDVLAHIVHEHLLRLPDTQILFNTPLQALEQGPDGVTVTVGTADGQERMRCDWLVGCDGGRSTVRKLLDLEFQGHTWPERFVANNIYYDEFEAQGYGLANFYCDPGRWAVFAVISRDGLWRVTYNDDGDISDAEALARVPDRLGELLPGSGRCKVAASSPYRVHERISEQLRVGRVLLAGDAAHVCNPCGGMGLTTGLMDANALIDALPAVIGARTDDSVLDFYAQDRRRVFLEISSPAATGYKRLLGESDPAQRREDLENLKRVAADPALMRQNMLSLFDVRGKAMPV